jgi:tetratricopeptide (TPR) repeat protein
MKKLSLLLTIIFISCTKHEKTAAPEPIDEVIPTRARLMCLAQGPEAKELARAQALAKKLPRKLDGWIVAAREWVKAARRMRDANLYLHADACAEASLAIQPGNLPGLELRALVLMQDHEFEKAKRAVEQILAEDPTRALALGVLADAALELGQIEEARDAVQRRMDLSPDAPTYARASHLYWLHGQTEDAKIAIREALAIGRDENDPHASAQLFVQAAELFWGLGDYDGADAIYLRALDYAATDHAALRGRAKVALSRHQPLRAIEILQRLDQNDPQVAWLLADAYELAGDEAHAKEQQAKVLALAHGDGLLIARFLSTKGIDAEKAVAAIEAEASHRSGIEIEDVRAWAHYRAGRCDAAKRGSEKAIALGTREARLWYHAGAIQLACGDRERGKRLIAEALALNPGFDVTGAREAKELL